MSRKRVVAMAHGAIVLAAYRPDAELFTRQLRSIRNQSERDWTCIVVADGETAEIAATMAAAVGDDDRFRLVGDGSRLGFYLNFERGLRSVPADAEWVALSDQDDFWYPEKLERLLTYLDRYSLVSGQARLVEHPSGIVLGETERRSLGPLHTALNNQFTGSLCVLRSELLRVALPFPRASTRAAAHDHWLAVVAECDAGAVVVDEIVQDYVQHGANVFGDPSRDRGALRARVRNVRRFADDYEGAHNPAAIARMTFWAFVGWRQLMVQAIADRRPGGALHPKLDRVYGRGRRFWSAVRVLRRASSERYVPATFVVAYLASWLSGVLVNGRRLPRAPR